MFSKMVSVKAGIAILVVLIGTSSVYFINTSSKKEALIDKNIVEQLDTYYDLSKSTGLCENHECNSVMLEYIDTLPYQWAKGYSNYEVLITMFFSDKQKYYTRYMEHQRNPNGDPMFSGKSFNLFNLPVYNDFKTKLENIDLYKSSDYTQSELNQLAFALELRAKMQNFDCRSSEIKAITFMLIKNESNEVQKNIIAGDPKNEKGGVMDDFFRDRVLPALKKNKIDVIINNGCKPASNELKAQYKDMFKYIDDAITIYPKIPTDPELKGTINPILDPDVVKEVKE